MAKKQKKQKKSKKLRKSAERKTKKIKKPISKPRRIKTAKKIKQPKRISKPLAADIVRKTKIRIIGIGGGGGSIISEIALRVKKADFLAANTDIRTLKGLPKNIKKFQFGQELTRGLGTGMNVETGELAAQNEKEKIQKLFEGQDLCIIISCLGGGTGSGSADVFAKISKNAGCLTYGIFTLPFKFEGERKMEIAKAAIEKVKPHLNIFSIIPNERIFRIIDKDAPLKDALSAINKRLAENLEGLIEMIYLPGIINIDFADLKTILQGRGKLAYLNFIEFENTLGEEALKKLFSSALYPYTIKGAKGILYNIGGGADLQLAEVSQISKTISELANKKAKIIFGISQSKGSAKPNASKTAKNLKITLLATGCGTKELLPSVQAETPFQKTTGSKPVFKKEKFLKPKQKTGQKKDKKSAEKNKPGKKAEEKKKTAEKKTTKPKDNSKKIKVVVHQEANQSKKIRKNALQLRREVEEAEKELLDQEKFWETPAILRKK